ncbi:hypothetical protein BDZ89DRAFT_538207 [Hymenopellis radicata]|nr:hypothetical protein BDZ89DRAFT_538207 [Hymenopellis radicata]
MPSYSANEAKVPYPTPSASPPPTLKRKRPSSPAPPNKKARTSPAGISHILQREFEAHLRGDRYKAKYHAGRSKSQALLHENDVLLKRVRESEELEGQVEVLRARNEEARRTSEAVHEQTTRDIVEV